MESLRAAAGASDEEAPRSRGGESLHGVVGISERGTSESAGQGETPLPGPRAGGTNRRVVTVSLGYLVTLLVLLVLNFALPRAMPGDPLSAQLAAGSPSYIHDPELQQAVRDFYGLDEPLTGQFRTYITGVATGDLGVSVRYQRPVSDMLVERLPRTVLLVGTALVLGTAAGVAAGAVAGWRRGGRFDSVALAVVTVVRSVPVFFLASAACYVLAVQLGWFPVSGSGTRFAAFGPAERVVDVLWHLALPASVLVVYHAAAQFLVMRAGMVTQLGADHLLTARAKGLPERVVRRRHAARNAMLPVIGLLGVQAGVAITGAVLVETVFRYDGIGSLLVDAISHRDYPLIQGCFLLLTCLVLVASFVADLVTARIDPRTAQ
ncbi:ABC transporter permease [Phytoactinopolyspora mesophila]|nr:ABC transporter permease [Phytoactinopolyspora mesophila]